MTARRASPLIHCAVALLTLCMGIAQAQPTPTPRHLIDHLGVEIRQTLENTKSNRTPEDAERAAAEHISELVRTSPGHSSLTNVDDRGRTPLMLAASSGYPQVVQALLADPGVKQGVNATDEDGATAWMHANFAPMLKEAGADTNADEAKRLWLARCPNASPELREALGSKELLPTLISDSLARQREFNRLAKDAPKSIPYKPPAGTKFIQATKFSRVEANSPAADPNKVTCVGMSKDLMPDHSRWTNSMQRWKGSIHIKLSAATRAGIIETADLDVFSSDEGAEIAEDFSQAILKSLATYQCDGDRVFEQEFKLKIE